MILNKDFLKFGYYQVGDKCFNSKVEALVQSTKDNIHCHWVFNNQFFDHINWQQEPSESIDELYRQRALQLRETYDYLILMYTGGSDSQNILNTFLKNNIKIDEVVAMHSNESLAHTYTPDETNYDWTNIQSEWDFNTLPKLKALAKSHPKIKITMHDWGYFINKKDAEHDFIMHRNHNFTPYAEARWDFNHFKSIRDRIDKSDKVGIVFGSDKPRICINNNAYCFYFLDIYIGHNGPQISSELLKEKSTGIELFYWDTNSWKILVKQAHLLVNFFEQNPYFKFIIQWPIKNPAHRQFYETAVRSIVYPTVDLRMFQVEKPKEMNYGMDRLLFKCGEEDRLRSIQKNNFDHLQRIIDKKYFHVVNNETTITAFFTGMWPVKYLSDK